jgi:hypothetical protein
MHFMHSLRRNFPRLRIMTFLYFSSQIKKTLYKKAFFYYENTKIKDFNLFFL